MEKTFPCGFVRRAAVTGWAVWSALAAAATDPSAAAAQQARDLVRAAAALDAEGVIALTHPRVHELSGGAAESQARLRATFASLRTKGLAHELGLRTLERAEILAPGKPWRASPQVLAVFVPYRAIEQSHHGRTAVRAFYLGLSEDGGRRWRFVDGAQLDSPRLRQFAPAWPGQPELPARSRQALPGPGR